MSRGGPTKDWAIDCKVYIGDLGYGAAKEELEEKFGRFGTLRNVWVARNPPGFAFVEFTDPRDAQDATRSLDGTRINNRRCRVEMSVEKPRRGPRGPPPRRPGPPRRDGYSRGPPRRGSYGRSPSPRRRSRSPYRSRSRSPKGRDWNRERDRPRYDRR